MTHNKSSHFICIYLRLSTLISSVNKRVHFIYHTYRSPGFVPNWKSCNLFNAILETSRNVKLRLQRHRNKINGSWNKRRKKSEATHIHSPRHKWCTNPVERRAWDRRRCIEWERVVSRLNPVFRWAKWLCRFLSRKQIFGKAPTDRGILCIRTLTHHMVLWLEEDIKSIFKHVNYLKCHQLDLFTSQRVCVWKSSVTQFECLTAPVIQFFAVSTTHVAHLIYRKFRKCEQMQSVPPSMRTTAKRTVFVTVILIKFHLWWFRQPNTIQPIRMHWWSTEWVALPNGCYANRIVFDIWKSSQHTNSQTKSHE